MVRCWAVDGIINENNCINDVALQYIAPSAEDIRVLRGHQLSITCLVITPDDRFVFSGSKDCSIIKCKEL